MINLTAGYYAINMDKESVPYMAFYIEGQGYFVYLQMPFGLTGAPTTFCEMVAIALDNMINKEMVSCMNNICIVDDNFEAKITKMRKFFNRCWEKALSLTPAKCKLFQSKVLFGGVAGLQKLFNSCNSVIQLPMLLENFLPHPSTLQLPCDSWDTHIPTYVYSKYLDHNRRLAQHTS